MNQINSQPAKASRQLALQRTIWRWHFYAGIFCIPFILVLSFSGAVYLFKPQMEDWREQAYLLPTPGPGQPSTQQVPNAQIDAARAALPSAKFLSYRLPRNSQSPNQTAATRITLQDQGRRTYIYVNPYTLSIMGTQAVDDVFVEWMKDLHGHLLIGDKGALLVELAACWAIVLIITGLYLWWPRNRTGFAGVLYPRLHMGGRQCWRDLHAVSGIWVSGLALFLLISGLPWTTVWGEAFRESRGWIEQQTSQDWSTSPSSARMSWRSTAAEYVDLQPATLTMAQALNLPWPSELSISDESSQQWKLASVTQNRPLRQTVWIDGDTQTVLHVERFEDKALIDRIIGIGIAAHEGQLFGWFNQLLGVFTALALSLISISGFVLWRQRKPKKRLGAPSATNSRLRQQTAGNVILAITLLAAVLLPLLGISLIVILILERLVLRRVPTINYWLGLTGG